MEMVKVVLVQLVPVQLAPPPERPSPVISPFWMVNGMTRSNGLSPATSSPFIPIGRSVACGSEVRGQEGSVPTESTPEGPSVW